MDRRKFLQMAGVGAASPFFNLEALAQGPMDRVLIVTEMTPNSLDTHTVGANRGAYGVVWMTYDRLITFGTKTLPNGVQELRLLQSQAAARRELGVRARQLRRDLQAPARRHLP